MLRRFVVLAGVLALTAVGCPRSGVEGQRAADNLLVISFDTTRADHLTPYGYEAPTSPNVASLAARGALFERAYTHVPSTLPAHSTMMTGLLPPQHGVRCNGKFKLSDDNLTLAEILSAGGFATGAVVGAFPLAARFGLAQGFASYDDDFSESAVTARRRQGRMDTPGFWIGHDYLDFERGADEVTDLSIAWLEGNVSGGRRWFLFAHYFDPHWPYEPPPGLEGELPIPYDAEIASADRELGRLLDAVAALPGRTLIVFTSDHGEGLGEHNEQLHNRYLYNSTLQVPLIIALEGAVTPGRRIDGAVGHMDLLPTVLELLGMPPRPDVPGRSLVQALIAGAAVPPEPVYAETLIWTLERPMGIDVRAMIDGGLKLIRTRIAPVPGRPAGGEVREVYDVVSDRAELTDLGRLDPGLVDRLAAQLDAFDRDLAEGSPEPESLMLDEGARERLRSLGYL